MFYIPNITPDMILILFSVFPESKENIQIFRDKQTAEGTLLTDALRAEIVNVVVPECYNLLIEQTNKDRKHLITDFKDSLKNALIY